MTTKPTGRSTSLRTYARLDKEKRGLEDRLKKLKVQIEETSHAVLDHFQKLGIDRVTVEGVTIYVRRELWAGREQDVSVDQACTALKDAGLSEYAHERVNTQSLSAYVRELDAAGEPLPAELQGVIKVSEVFKLSTRMSS